MRLVGLLGFCALAVTSWAGSQGYSIEEAVSVAQKENPDIVIARKKLQAAQGGIIEARSGYLPSVISSGLFREREHQSDSRLRNEDYNASVRVVQSLYSGGAVASQLSIARLNLEKQQLELDATINRVAGDVRIAFNDVLLNRAKIRVHEQSVGVLGEELKTQQQRFGAGTVGQLNVSRAQLALANEEPLLVDARTQLKNSELHLAELLGSQAREADNSGLDVTGQLQYQPRNPDLNQCLARAQTERPEIRAREIDVAIAEQQILLDQSELKPQVEAFTGYEVYNERDPDLGKELNYGYVVGVNAKWHIFDGFATKGKVIASRARRDAAQQELEAAKLSVGSDVRSALFDLQQATQMLEGETRNVQTADNSLEIAKANAAAGLGTQLDVLQAASDVTRTRTSRLTAIYMHNVALARLARACAVSPGSLDVGPKISKAKNTPDDGSGKAADLARPPAKLTTR